MSLKHSKKNNSAIVFEQLVKVMTRLVMEGKQKEAKIVVDLIKEHFSSKSNLGKERKLIYSLVEASSLSEKDAKEVLAECLTEAQTINKKKLQEEKVALLNSVNSVVGKDLYNVPVDNYKLLASVQILFNEEREGYKSTTPQERVKIKNTILESLTSPLPSQEEQVDNLTFKVLINKFNEKYGKVVSEDQRDVLKAWVDFCVKEDSDKLKNVLKEKFNKVNVKISLHEEKVEHKDYSDLLKEVKQKVLTFDLNKEIDEEMIYETMRFFDLCDDLDIVSDEDFLNE